MIHRMKQIKLLQDLPKAYGGELFNTRKGRSQPRPIVTKTSMHLVLKSSFAVKERSFLMPSNKQAIRKIIKKFSLKYGVQILSGANVGNHLHFHVKFANRSTYKPFIRAITSAIAMSVMGVSRWKTKTQVGIKKFWDYRPFTRVIVGMRGYLNINNYIEINKLESQGIKREAARMIIHARFQPLGP